MHPKRQSRWLRLPGKLTARPALTIKAANRAHEELMPVRPGKRPVRRSTLRKPAQAEASSRDLLLAAARDDFAAGGFDGARVDAIASPADVHKHLVYPHFGNKHGRAKSRDRMCQDV